MTICDHTCTYIICDFAVLYVYCNRATAAHERATEAEERSQSLEATLTQERLRAQESERRLVYTSREQNS